MRRSWELSGDPLPYMQARNTSREHATINQYLL
jgi:hypothetical protein